MNKDSLGDRMKKYESVTRNYLTCKTPVIIRLDGKAFHSFTKGFQKPFDMVLMETMWQTTKNLCENIMNCKIGYTQSDEISLLLVDYDNSQTQPWFENNIQKMVSVSASMATLAFNKVFNKAVKSTKDDFDFQAWATQDEITYMNTLESKINTAMFDARVFQLPKEEVNNYFIWRQQDSTRNAIQMVAQANCSHKSLQGLSCNQIQEKLFQEKGINFDKLPTYQKRGACLTKEKYIKPCGGNGRFRSEVERSRWKVDKDIPIFTQDREYINKFVYNQDN